MGPGDAVGPGDVAGSGDMAGLGDIGSNASGEGVFVYTILFFCSSSAAEIQLKDITP